MVKTRSVTEPRPAEHNVEAIPGLDALATAIITLRNSDEVQRFLRDLCTLPELEALAHRWQTVLLSARAYRTSRSPGACRRPPRP
jgi:uncharacterized protein YerC